MRGVVCDGRSIRLATGLPDPEPGPGEVAVRVRRVGICETDLQLARGYLGFRGILGHEFVGIDLDGRRVVGEINNPCRACPTCRAGASNHCPNRTVTGIVGHDGAMAELVAVPRDNLHVVPDAIDDDRAVFVEPLAAAFRMAESVPIGPDARVAVVGDGKLGLLCARVARSAGAAVTLVGKHPGKLALGGAGVRPIHLDDLGSIGREFDVVADCTGSPTGLATALRVVRPRGTVVLKTTVAGEYAVDLAPIVIDEITVVGSRCGPFPTAIAALASGTIDVAPLIGSILPLDEAEAAFRLAGESGGRKVILRVD